MLYLNKLECFATVSYFHPRLIIAGTAGAYHNGAPYSTLGWLVALPKNVRLGWKWMEVANTLAYYNMATITTVKFFYNTDPWAQS